MMMRSGRRQSATATPLLEKFGVGDHVERKVETTVGEALRNVSPYPAGGADRHSALVDHHLAPIRRPMVSATVIT